MYSKTTSCFLLLFYHSLISQDSISVAPSDSEGSLRRLSEVFLARHQVRKRVSMEPRRVWPSITLNYKSPNTFDQTGVSSTAAGRYEKMSPNPPDAQHLNASLLNCRPCSYFHLSWCSWPLLWVYDLSCTTLAGTQPPLFCPEGHPCLPASCES